MMNRIGKITLIDENLIRATIPVSVRMGEIVFVGKDRLVGEVIKVRPGLVDIQVYEDTTMIKVNEPVEFTSDILEVELGPGLLQGIYNGLGYPLEKYDKFIERGVRFNTIDYDKKWEFKPTVTVNKKVTPGDIIGEVQETSLIVHKIMVPLGIEGKIKSIEKGSFTVKDTIAVVEDDKGQKHKLDMTQRSPIRKPRPVKKRVRMSDLLETKVRIIDGFIPLMKGGTGCIPGAFGTGKTVIEHTIARYARIRIVIYVGCGERAAEMVELIKEFPELTDPDTGRPLVERTVLIANTSAMPVAARESSVYLGMTIAEYFRDQGYDVLVLADSTSRWLQALREMSGRLEEIPGQEGFPAYLESRISEWYERAGKVICLGSDNREGSITMIGAVSPPGGDFSEPVTQATLKVTGCFFALSRKLAYARHYPALDPIESKSAYFEDLGEFFKKEKFPDWMKNIELFQEYIREGVRIKEQIDILGDAGVSNADYLTYQLSELIRKAYLAQDVFHSVDADTTLKRHYFMLEFIKEILNWAKNFKADNKDEIRKTISKITYELIQMNFQEDYEKEAEKIRKEVLKS